MKKRYIVIIIVVGLIGFSVYFDFGTQNSTSTQPKTVNQANPINSSKTATTTVISLVDTSDWEIYKDANVSYEIKHPKNLKVDIVGTKNYFGINICLNNYLNIPENLEKERVLAFDGEKGCFLSVYLSVRKVNNPNRLSAEDWIRANHPDDVIYTLDDNKKNMVIQGEQALEILRDTYDGLYDVTHSWVYILHNDYFYTIYFLMLPTSSTSEWKSHPYYKYLEQSVPITDAIIKSFRFIDSN